MKWLLLLTILSGYSGSSTATASFESKEACEAAGKSHDQAIPDREFLTGIAEICRRSRCQGISIK